MIKKNVMTKPPEQLFPEQELCQQGERINIWERCDWIPVTRFPVITESTSTDLLHTYNFKNEVRKNSHHILHVVIL